ncbi:MAG TPA: YaaL family protein [Pseudoneobacillus sp.]|nr:YaaL family protein [Pseudoneobacillus sp.]
MMFFRRKGWLRKEYDQKLLIQMEEVMQNRQQHKKLLEKCLDPSDDVIYQMKLNEAKYFFLLKEAKKRQVSLFK